MSRCRALLLDIEGTTTSISFVKDVLFPYAADRVGVFLHESLAKLRSDPAVKSLVESLITESEQLDKARCLAELELCANGKAEGGQELSNQLAEQCRNWIQLDKKVTSLKSLQGMIWERGYADGSLRGHIFPDVKGVMESLHAKRVPIYIFSSGSVKAQQLLFRYSIDGDLTQFLTGYFDRSNAGDKNASQSYTKIAQKMGMAPGDILFLTDVAAEAQAANRAGLRVNLVVREGNSPLSDDSMKIFPAINSFNTITAMFD